MASDAVDTRLVTLFGSEAKVRLLGRLLRSPEEAWHLRGLAAAAGVESGNASKALRQLLATGLVIQLADGRGMRYKANAACALVEPLRELFVRAGSLISDLQAVAHELPASQVHVFGSVANGADRVDSDVDVLVLGELSAIEAQAAFRKVGRKHGKKVDVLVLGPEQLARAVAENSAFLRAILENKVITLKGGSLDAAIREAAAG